MGSSLPVPSTAAGRAGLDAILAAPRDAVVALDFDGTLAPIVDDPEQARAHPDILPALSRLAPRLCATAIVTGRPAETAVDYGGFRRVPSLERLTVLGAYGAERWDAATDSFHSPAPPPGVAAVRDELPALLERVGAPAGTRVEDKERALAVHTRTAADPAGALELLRTPLAELAARNGLLVEPGRMVLELRPPGMDKGTALLAFLTERAAGPVLYAGDDLGDLAAYEAVERRRGAAVPEVGRDLGAEGGELPGEQQPAGMPGLLVCSGSVEVRELTERADLVVEGPEGVARLLTRLATALT